MSARQLVIELHEVPIKMVPQIEYEKVYRMLVEAGGSLAFACTYDQGRAIDLHMRRAHKVTVRVKAIAGQDGRAYFLTLYNGPVYKPRGVKAQRLKNGDQS